MFTQLSQKELYRNTVISLVQLKFAVDDGDEFDREVVRHIGAVSIVPLLTDSRVVLMSQFRASVGENVIEVAAGKRDVEGELPQDTAIRELEEEVGLRCSTVIELGQFYNSPGFTDEHSYSYLALGLSLGTNSPQSVEERYSSLVTVHLSDVPSLVSSGKIRDAKTIIGLCRAKEYLSCAQDQRDRLFPIVAVDRPDTRSIHDAPEISDWCDGLSVL